MTLQVIHLPLDGSQDDKTGRLLRGPNAMRHSVNVDHSHVGEVRKRRGTTRIPLTTTTHNETPEAVFVSLGVDALGELVLVGFRDTYGIAANDDTVDGAALVLRGPSCVGSYRTGVLHVSAYGRET